MSRKQVGSIDADLLAEVDRRAGFLGQTRRVFVERALQARLANPDLKITSGEEFLAGTSGPNVAHDLPAEAKTVARRPRAADPVGKLGRCPEHPAAKPVSARGAWWCGEPGCSRRV